MSVLALSGLYPLQARWAGHEPAPTGRTTRLSPEERQAVWDDARRAASDAAAEIRRLTASDPAGAAQVARDTADLLQGYGQDKPETRSSPGQRVIRGW